MPDLDNSLIRDAMRELRLRLPTGWTVGEPSFVDDASDLFGIDAMVKLTAPDRRAAILTVQAKSRIEPRVARGMVEGNAPRPPGTLLIVTRYISEGARSLLREGNASYLDLTGNVRLVVNEPGLFIETQGASEDPERETRSTRSLRGPKAGRIIRALIDYREPLGVRELAAQTDIDASYVSRVFSMLDAEALITRARGRLEQVDWPALLRRWAQEAPLESRGQMRTYLEPRGLPSLLQRLPKSNEQYAITGSMAASTFAPIAPARLATIWIRNVDTAAPNLGLRPADTGANVLLIEPTEDGAFERATQRDGLSYAAPSQIAADLLSSAGRGPNEGEELITWMQANEGKWRL